MREDTVVVTGYLSDGKLACEQVFSIYSWYEKLHPLIDNDTSRKFYKITKIIVKQYDLDMRKEVTWENNYRDDGSLIDTWKEVDGQREQVWVPKNVESD